jgi:DNA-cytosine methyltransferase
MKLKILDLFSGIGGFSLGLESTGHFETAAFCEIEPYCQKVLKKHWPDVPIFDDIRQLKGTDIGTIDIITGGYPCQPFSVAGKQKAEQDPRHLWPEYFRLIQELRPTWVIGENVSGHIKLGLDSVLEDLESEGYSTRTFSISASSIGANHKRERIWIIGHKQKNSKQYPTPTVSDRFPPRLPETMKKTNRNPLSNSLGDAVQDLLEGKSYPEVRKPLDGGSLNPEWVEWLMGFPKGWTDLKPSETP